MAAIIKICGHIIKTAEIAGIGPLMVQEPRDPAQRDHNARQFFFLLHLKAHSVRIESEWFELGDGKSARNKEDNQLYHQYEQAYGRLCLKIEKILSGPKKTPKELAI